MAWKPGQSGNPRGNPASAARKLALDKRSKAQPEIVEFLLTIMRDEKQETRDRIAAAKTLHYDEATIKVEQTVTHQVSLEVSDVRRKLADRLAALGFAPLDARGALGSGVRAPTAQLVDVGAAGSTPSERAVDAVVDPSGARVGEDADRR